MRLEEGFAKEKSRIQWLQNGDKNLPFFHQMIKSHISKNYISKIIDGQGLIQESKEGIDNAFIHFYKELLGSAPSSAYLWEHEDHFTFNTTLEESQIDLLGAGVTSEEIKAALFSMKDGKSPGPDGFPAGFFKFNWEVVGSDFTSAIHNVFNCLKLVHGVNATHLALIPKLDNPESVSHFRPIALCNVTYKCVSKVLANRIKLVLPSIISPNQAAFVHGRNILDNILLSHELIRNFHRSSISSRCALKMDLRKAFDSVRWETLSSRP